MTRKARHTIEDQQKAALTCGRLDKPACELRGLEQEAWMSG